jgi:hypothetical protein
MEQFDFPTAETKDIIATFLNQSCVLLRNFVDVAALDRAYDMTLKAYARVDGYHIYPDHLRQLGMPMYSDILFGERHFDLLRELFGEREYEISADTCARRVGRVRAPPHWLPPLGPHLDAFVHPSRFTVNFWVPFQECGVDAPGLGVVRGPFADVLSFAGYQNGAKVWDDPEPKGHYADFRPEMKALHRNHDPEVIAQMRERFSGRITTPAFKPGDAMMLSNWTLHQTHATAAMVKTRENMELRFWSTASLQDILREHDILRERGIAS